VAAGACVVFTIGGSGTGLAVQAKLEEIKVPHGSPANSLDALTNPVRKYYFRAAPKGSLESKAIIKFMTAKYGSPKIVIVNDNTRTSLLGADEWEKSLGAANLETVGRIQFESGTADLSAQVLRIKELKPDVVLIAASVPDSANFIRNFKRLKLDIPLQGTYAMSGAAFADLVGELGDGLVIIDGIDPARAEVQAILKSLEPYIGDRAFKDQALAVMAWEFSRLFTDAFEKVDGKCDREGIRNALEATRDWPTALGQVGKTVNFSETNHDVFSNEDDIVMRLFENGRLGRAID
jgi:ABC-type branched-subunit amino acid transport system substrate-binding protein